MPTQVIDPVVYARRWKILVVLAISLLIIGLDIGLGPFVGGLLLEWSSWSSVFWLNVPIVAGALIGGLALVPSITTRCSSATLDQPPVLMGHSVGGLIVELLLDRNLGRAGVAISPAPRSGRRRRRPP